MKRTLTGGLTRAQRLFAGFTSGQKTITAIAVLALVIGGALFSQWVTKPSYAPLFSHLSTTDASAIVDKLGGAGVPFQLTDGGTTILVPQDKVYATRLQMSGEGLPVGDSGGYALLDKQGLTTSEFQQQVGFQRALEGELKKTVESLDGVRSAAVHLAIPQKDVFTSDKDSPTASVLVSMGSGDRLATTQVQAIVNLVASSVTGMTPEDVTVADSTGRVLSAAGQPAGLAAGDQRAQQTSDFEARTANALQDMVDQVVGSGHAVVKVTADLDYDQTSTTTERYVSDPENPPLADTTTKESYQGSGASVGGVLGPDNAGVPMPGAGTDTKGTTYTKDSVTRNNAVGKVVEVRKAAPGAIRKLNVGILLDTRTAGTVDPAELQTLVSSAIGIDPARGDTIEVTRLPFDETAAEAAEKALAAERDAAGKESMVSLAKTGGLVLLVLAVLVLAFLSSRKRRVELSPEERVQLEVLQRELAARGETPALDEVDELPAIEPARAPVDPHLAQVAAARDEIGELLEAQPAEVAQLLRGWLADRRS
ncbi:MAG TPA: flagellar basal-body MS-ring/collar protein FliF [Actinomycetes bacterium]|nr:flagellar basal-body MS-ring/collar protein FliF [Actinomycetes bacterium]